MAQEKKASKAEPATFATPTITLPKGGGALRGIGEKFTATPATGTCSLSIPLPASPGRSGFGPQLALSYDSGAGNGPFGIGWSLSIPSITRKTDKGLPQYRDDEESDVFIISGAEDLVPVLRPDGCLFEDDDSAPGYTIRRYRPRIEGLFARIERWTARANGDIHWCSITRDNVTTLYGKTPESRIADPCDPRRVFTWLICESYDDKGNAIAYRYAAENDENVLRLQANERHRVRGANRYLKCVNYGNRVSRLVQPDLDAAEWLFRLVFDYGDEPFEALPADLAVPSASQHRFVRAAPSPDLPWDASRRSWAVRPDPFSQYRAGFEVRTYRRCRRVLMYHAFDELGESPYLVRCTEFDFNDLDDDRPAAIDAELAHQGSTRFASFIGTVTHSGFVRDGSRGEASYLRKSMPPLDLQYSKAVIQDEIRELDAGSARNLPLGIDGATHRFVDLNGEGAAGVLTEEGGAWFYKPSLGDGRFGPAEMLPAKPSPGSLAGGRQELLDLAGDGHLDVVAFSGPMIGFFERTDDDDWKPFRSFEALPHIRWDDPNLRFVDLNGDGHADVLIAEDEVFTWYPSLAEEGFEPARRVDQPFDDERGPRLVFSDGTQSIYLADMSGDGLTDIARIRNGEVCYWPNIGYGRFGAKVTMDDAPWFDNPDQFTQQRIRLADINGSGMSDIIYIGRDGVRLYFNQSGNRWSGPRRLRRFPALDNISSVAVADLLGNGTACLVWSSPLPEYAHRPLRYIDLMGGQKPNLLIRSINNLGAETHVHYAPSTKFYFADKAAGAPWITRLPFPVHAVERVETLDRVSGNRFVTRYAFHHGYFDGVEREFRGFGMVEQWDTEEVAMSGDVDSSLQVPPVYMKTWFHTGVYLGRERISDFFAGSLAGRHIGGYFREPGLTDSEARKLLLDDTVLPQGLTNDEEREACRALKGSMLRQEIYAHDGTTKEAYPYSVTEQNFTIRVLQRICANRHAVFFAHSREAISYQYERNPADPRIHHALTLAVDDFGNVLQSVAVGYGRCRTDPALSTEDQANQARTLVTLSEHRVTNSISETNDYRAPLASEGRAYELTGLGLPAGRDRFTLDEMSAAATGATLIAYGENPTPGAVQKRLIEEVRTLYRRNDLAGPLRSGELQSQALPFESYKLALTPDLAAGIYGERVTDTTLATEGGYVHFEGDANWWIPSGRVFFSPNTDDSSPEEAAHARKHFFQAARYRDPFHSESVSTETVVSYDRYDLFVSETRDPLGNIVTVNTADDAGNTAVRIDYRVLQPYWVTDPNGNRTAIAFDALGMVAGTAVMGRPLPAPAEGDSLQDFMADLTEAVTLAHITDPLADPESILGRATNRVLYDLFAYSRSVGTDNPQPGAVYTLRRETHFHAAGDAPTKIQHTFLYSDGFQREIQTKLQAEPGPAPRRESDSNRLVLVDGSVEMAPANPRWVGTGRTIYNVKGSPVRKYEPFFSSIHSFESEPEMVLTGVTPVIHYDPLQRVIRTDLPDGTFTTLDFNPWRLVTSDVNDNVLESPWYAERRELPAKDPERRAADLAARHAGTSTTGHFDTLGRTFLVELDNGSAGKRRTRTDRDIQGNITSITDALGRTVLANEFDLLRHAVRIASVDAGERRHLLNVAGKLMATWDSRGHRVKGVFDPLQRPTHLFVQNDDGSTVMAERTVYGELHPNAIALNLRGKIFQQFHGAGVTTSESYDFKGNPTDASRRMAKEYKRDVDWSPLASLKDIAEIAAAAEPLLEEETFTLRIAYDALNRPAHLTAPDQSEIRTIFNEASLLERVDGRLRATDRHITFVSNVDYNARRQRTRIEYGNDVRTEYEYDPKTFRLARLRTKGSGSATYLQDLTYTYDPIGNITTIRDAAQQTTYFDNQVVAPGSQFEYDALYQLVAATGREHLGQNGQLLPPRQPGHDDGIVANRPHPADGRAMGNYLERYRFDDAGNILSVSHTASNGSWTRRYDYDPSNNRLQGTSLPADADGEFSAVYRHDGHGNMVRMPHLPEMGWNFKDQLRELDLGGGGRVHYTYDAAGQRTRKVWRKSASLVLERLYLGPFEIVRRRNENGIVFERQTLMIMDGQKRIAIVETKTIDEGAPAESPAPLLRYQFENHLGSSSLELDDLGAVITYEEYFPWGGSSFRSVTARSDAGRKRYRYQAKERDEETGLDYFGARYYASWLGRWTSPDPEGLVDGLNLYRFVRNNPIVLKDPAGTQSEATSSQDADDPRVPKALEEVNKYLLQEVEKVRAGHPDDNLSMTSTTTHQVLENGMLSVNVSYTIVRTPRIQPTGELGSRDLRESVVITGGTKNFTLPPIKMEVDAPPEQESLPVRALEGAKEIQEKIDDTHTVAESIPVVKKALEKAEKGKLLKGMLKSVLKGAAKALKFITHKAVGPILEGATSIAKGIETKSVRPIVQGAGAIVGGLAGGYVGGVVGGVVGAVVFGAIGSIFGPAGTVAGVWLGEMVGTAVGEVIGAHIGSDLGEKAADFLFEFFTEKVPKFFDRVMSQVEQSLGPMIRGEERGYRWFYVQ